MAGVEVLATGWLIFIINMGPGQRKSCQSFICQQNYKQMAIHYWNVQLSVQFVLFFSGLIFIYINQCMLCTTSLVQCKVKFYAILDSLHHVHLRHLGHIIFFMEWKFELLMICKCVWGVVLKCMRVKYNCWLCIYVCIGCL